MAGVGPVSERSAYSSATQQASTMMAAQGSLSHEPGASWACHTPTGDDAAGNSNLALGVSGIRAIDAYVRDPGSNNHSVGHRRTLLYPQLLEVGSGDGDVDVDVDVDGGNGFHAAKTLHVFDDNVWGARPGVRERQDFVAWLPAGYVPAETTWGRWSFSLFSGDFSAASVTVTDSLGAIRVQVLDRIQSENPGDRIAPEPVDGDECYECYECYEITISGVQLHGVTQPDYRYSSCVIDLDFEPSSIPTPARPAPSSSSTTECDAIEFGLWTVPCWTDDRTLAGFTDVTASWQREPVAWLVGNGVTTGVSASRFDPDASLTRAQAATLIWRLVGSPTPPSEAPTFADVPSNAYYADAVRWMARFGITNGTGADRFSPNAPATRAEFVTFLWRLVDEPITNGSMPFTDLTAGWQTSSVRWAAASEVTTGISATKFAPNATVTRGQAAALLARFAGAVSYESVEVVNRSRGTTR
jgi:hypothetical protein